MDVIPAAAAIGLTIQDGDDVLGTIEELIVLDTLAELARANPGHDDLFAEAVTRVQLSRSAGFERTEPGSVFAVRRSSTEIQLHYRADMVDVFLDLAIDLGLRTPVRDVAEIVG